ncbi:MAG: fumarate hydratase [Lentisphaeria bacterium]|nr:fumarate hydratase [Lentisphaeria bacterium]
MSRTVKFDEVVEAASALCGQAACFLPEDVKKSLLAAAKREAGEPAKEFFRQYEENFRIAEADGLPLCQDTGFAVWFVEYGTDVRFDKKDIYAALEEGTRQGYTKHFLRKSIVADPLFDRKNTRDNTPCIVHLELVPGDRIGLTLAPKGGGSENMSALKMLKPSDGRAGVVKFVVDTVVSAGGNPCPPTVVGVGIGGTMEKAAILAKTALLREVGRPADDPRYAELEREILEKINSSGVGPQGLGGSVTSLAVHILHHPCHLASLPVAVNINCHAARHARIVL